MKKAVRSMKKSYLNILIGIILFSSLILAFYLWKNNSFTEDINNFGLNLFTEILGIFITVLVIEKIITIKKEKDDRLIKAACYREIQMFLSRYFGLWFLAYHSSVPGENPKTIEEFYTLDNMSKIEKNLDLDSLVENYPPICWWDYFKANIEDLKQRVELVLLRYSNYLEPEIY